MPKGKDRADEKKKKAAFLFGKRLIQAERPEAISG